MRAWIEIESNGNPKAINNVALFMRAWIEMLKTKIRGFPKKGRSLHESVDWNTI